MTIKEKRKEQNYIGGSGGQGLLDGIWARMGGANMGGGILE